VNFFDRSLHQNGNNKEAKNGHQAYFNSGFSIGPALAGSELAASDFTALEARWIDGPLALAVQLRRVDSLTGAELVGRKSGNHAGVAIPYFFPGTSEVREYRIRRDHPDMEIDSKGQVKPKQKISQPPGRGNIRSSTSVSEVLEKCVNKPQAQWTQADKNRVGRSLRTLGWERYRERERERLEWRWRRLPSEVWTGAAN